MQICGLKTGGGGEPGHPGSPDIITASLNGGKGAEKLGRGRWHCEKGPTTCCDLEGGEGDSGPVMWGSGSGKKADSPLESPSKNAVLPTP